MRGRVGSILVAALLLPTAIAATGTVDLVGPITLHGVALDGQVHSLLVNETVAMTALILTADRLTVHTYTITYANAPMARLSATNESATYELTDATVTLAEGSHEGWAGVYASSGTGLRTSVGTADVTAALSSTLANGVGPTEEEAMPGYQVFIRTLDRPHLRATIAAPLELEGRIGVKLRGPDIRISSNENTTTLATGEETTPATIVARWAYLEAAEGTLSLACDCAADVLIETPLRASWSALTGFAAQATIEEGSRRYDAANAETTVEGAFESTLAADAAGRLEVRMEGDLHATDARVTRVEDGSVPPLALLAGLTLAAGGIGAAIAVRARRSRRTAPVLTVEDHADLAARSLDEGDHAQALAWLRRARQDAPTSARLMIDEGYCLDRLGQHEAAIDLYQLAASASTTGEADFLRAQVLARLGRDEEAIASLSRALERDPWLAPDIDAEESFSRLRRHAGYARLLGKARRRAEDGG